MIKFLDINRQDKNIHKKILSDISKLIKKTDFILGDNVKKFENKFAKFCGTKYAIGCGNGTDALTIALKSLNLRKNSEIIIPAMTYCSTAFAIINAGFKPILVDTDYLSPNISIIDLKKKITNKTSVIMPVHLYGSSANLSGIKKIIKNKNIYLIDDCSQAHGGYDDSINNNKKIGSTSDISCFSLYPAKNLGAYGDAGIITTNNKILYKRIKNIRNLGSDFKFKHTRVGVNSRLDTIQATILLRKIKYLNNINKKKINIAKLYNQNINNKKISKLKYSKSCVYHQYVIIVKNRKKLISIFKKKGIPFNLNYPYAIHQLHALRKYFKKKHFPNAEKLASNGISLPIDSNLKEKNVFKIINLLNSF